MEKIIFQGKPIEISEYKNHKIGTFLISILDEYNLNKTMIEKENGEKYCKTIIGYPILAYLKYDSNGNPADFGGHEVRVKQNKEGDVDYYFATTAIGSVLDAWIEEREVEGYSGTKSCIMIKAKLWSSRYPEYFEVLDELWEEGKVSTSWEVSVSESVKTIKGKILKVFEFIGNCILGATVTPAVTGAGMLEYAEVQLEDNNNIKLANALGKDFQGVNINNSEMEDDEMPKGNMVSSLTVNDLYSKITDSIRNKIDNWGYISYMFPEEKKVWFKSYGENVTELDYLEFIYSVDENDEVTVSDGVAVKLTVQIASNEPNPLEVKVSELESTIKVLNKEKSGLENTIATINTQIAEKDEALIKASEQINTLTASVKELEPYKAEVAEFKRAEKEAKLEKERNTLKEYATKSGFITTDEFETSEEIKSLIEKVDTASIKAIIADRFMQSLGDNPDVETSQVNANVNLNLNNGDEAIDPKSIIKNYLKSN